MPPLARAVGLPVRAAEGLVFAGLAARLGHAFAQAAVFEEVLFEVADLLKQ